MTDVLIIGSGPAGLSASIYAKRAGLNVLMIEKNFYGIGQIAESHQIDNYPGLPEINGYELGMKFRQHAESIGVSFVEKEGVSYQFQESSRLWKVTYGDGEIQEVKTIIYAAGAGHRHLNIPGEKELTGMGISYCATCDGAFYKGKDVAVIGGGNTALGDALYLCDFVNKVYVIHRRDEFRGATDTVNKLKQKENVEFVLNATPIEIKGTDMVEAVVLADGRSLSVNGVFIAVGMEPVTQPLKDVVEMDSYGYIVADEDCITSAPGFFVAGDVRTKNLRQIVTAVSDGANAVNSAKAYLQQHGS
ncbi:MAG: NAD(P)/FAD-dependent oxidoreductase [Lachnospiraceae bacterium]